MLTTLGTPDLDPTAVARRPDRSAIADAEPLLARQMVSELTRRELDPNAALRGLGFGVPELSSADFRVSYAQTSRLIRRAMQLVDDPNLGLTMGAASNPVTWGPCLLGMMASRDTHEMLELAIDYLPSTDRFLSFEREPGDEAFGIVVEPRFDDPDVSAFLVDNTFASLVRLGRHLVGDSFAPQSVDLRAAMPERPTRHEELFGCPVRFGQPSDVMRLPAQPTAIPTADPVIARMCRQMLAVKKPGERAPSALEEAIVRQIRADLKNPPSVRAVAASLNFSERTLRRRLLESDLSYTRLLDNERMRRAIALLTERRLSLPSVAEEAGFTDARSLRRAIKRWTGRTPTQIRRGEGSQ